MSWMIINKETGVVVCELFDKNNILKINTDKYIIKTALEYLCGLNKKNNER